MDRGSVIDAQITLEEQFGRIFPVHVAGVERDDFLRLWMEPNSYGVQVIKARGCPRFYPAYPYIADKFDAYGRIKT